MEIPCARNAERSRRADARRDLCVLSREKGCRPFSPHPFSCSAACLRYAPDRFFLTKPNTYGTIETPASLRSEHCSPSARNAVRVPFGISVRLRRNPQLRQRASVRPQLQGHFCRFACRTSWSRALACSAERSTSGRSVKTSLLSSEFGALVTTQWRVNVPTMTAAAIAQMTATSFRGKIKPDLYLRVI